MRHAAPVTPYPVRAIDTDSSELVQPSPPIRRHERKPAMSQRSDRRVALFSVLAFLALGAMPHAPASATTITFFNPAPIAIPGSGDSGPGAPYPSTITVS